MWYQGREGTRILTCDECGESMRSRPIYDYDRLKLRPEDRKRLLCARKRCERKRLKAAAAMDHGANAGPNEQSA